MKTGIYPKLAMQEYIALKAFSSGLAQTLLSKSPLHAWTDSPWNPDRERDDSDTADIGTFAHAMLLEGGTDALVICPFDDWRKNDAKAMRDHARSVGRLPILQHKVPEVHAMVEAAQEFVAASELAGVFDTGAAEQTVVFEIDGMLCKVRPDWLNDAICLSYKTTAGSAQPDAWIRTQLPLYDLGIALYGHGTGKQVITLAQEQKPPYSCSLIGLAPAWQAMAESRLALALATWESCLKSGKFPAYPARICWAEPKPWMQAETEEKQIEAAGNEYDISKLWSKDK